VDRKFFTPSKGWSFLQSSSPDWRKLINFCELRVPAVRFYQFPFLFLNLKFAIRNSKFVSFYLLPEILHHKSCPAWDHEPYVLICLGSCAFLFALPEITIFLKVFF